MDQVDVDCASCGYEITDFSNVVAVSCGHGFIHYNCSYFNNECSVCESKLTAETEDLQFRPREIQGESSNMKIQLLQISRSLNELKTLLVEQKKEHLVAIGSLTEQLKAKDEKIVELQKEIYEIKIANIESLKKELQDKLSNLA